MSNINTGISQLPVSNEIINGDYLIIDNGIETRRLDFKDFILGLSNVTFAATVTSNYYDIATLSSYTVNAINGVYTNMNTISTSIETEISVLSTDIYTDIYAISANVDTLSLDLDNVSTKVDTISTNLNTLSSNFYGQTPTAAVLAASTHYIKIRINNTNYALLLSATS
jgi:hypothetical protein